MTGSMTSEGSGSEDGDKELILDPPKPRPPAPWYEDILSEDDLDFIDPHR